jgi:hypothetical protein
VLRGRLEAYRVCAEIRCSGWGNSGTPEMTCMAHMIHQVQPQSVECHT